MKVRIYIVGCDDTTAINMEISEEEEKFLEKLCDLSIETSTYKCEPVINYYRITED